MKKKYQILWSIIAEKDLRNIIEYICRDKLAIGQKIFKKIKEKALTLDEFPERGRLVPEFKYLGILLYREIIIPPWRIIYRISNKKIFILAVLDSRQNIEEILFDRLINQEI